MKELKVVQAVRNKDITKSFAKAAELGTRFGKREIN